MDEEKATTSETVKKLTEQHISDLVDRGEVTVGALGNPRDLNIYLRSGKFLQFQTHLHRHIAEMEIEMTPEKKIQNAAIKYATGKGIPSIRMYFGPGIQTGWPDVLFLIKGGRPLYIEFKAPGNIPTKKQEKKITILRDLDYDVCWTDNLEEAKEMIDDAYYVARSGG